MYEGIKTATGSTSVKTAPLKSKTGEVITDQSMQLQRRVEHYLELYSTQNIVTDTALNALPGLPVIEELDNTPTLEELSIAIDGLACGKAAGKDGIPPHVLRHGNQTILQPLHVLLCLCWEQGHIPQDMRDTNIVTLYKNEGDRSDCNNYRGISLLSIVGKVRVTLTRLQSLASQVYLEPQCGFRAGRSTVDMIFSLRQLQEKCREQQQPLFLAFVDLTKAFDLVSRRYSRRLAALQSSWRSSPGHAEYGLLRWGHLQCLPNQQWSKTGLCLRPDEVRRQTLQHRQTPRQNQSLRGAYMGAAVCRRRCFNIPQRGGPPTSGRQAVPRLQEVWANDQPQEDQHPGAKC